MTRVGTWFAWSRGESLLTACVCAGVTSRQHRWGRVRIYTLRWISFAHLRGRYIPLQALGPPPGWILFARLHVRYTPMWGPGPPPGVFCSQLRVRCTPMRAAHTRTNSRNSPAQVFAQPRRPLQRGGDKTNGNKICKTSCNALYNAVAIKKVAKERQTSNARDAAPGWALDPQLGFVHGLAE